MVTAYVLLQANVLSVQETVDIVSGDPGVAWADPITGPYDVIAALEADPHEVLPRLRLPGAPAPSPVPQPPPERVGHLEAGVTKCLAAAAHGTRFNATRRAGR